MVTISLHCPHCGSEALVRDGHAPNGKQKVRCHACGRRSRQTPTPNASPQARREEILHASQERSSLGGLTRTFGVSRATVSSWLTKKSLSFLLYGPPWSPPTQRTPLPPPWNSMSCGHLCSQKPTTPGCGIALCRQTRQVVAYAVGDRSKQTCQRLWEAIAQEYRQGHCFTDFLSVYASVIPQEQHTALGKETGETAHVERWKNTLRQRLARFVRMTLSFSKSVVMHEACLLLFLHRYHLERALLLT